VAYADLTSPVRLAALLARHGLYPRRRLGQHFLVDANVVTRIIAASGVGPAERAFEVGPGLGVATRPLAERAREVVALELDSRFLPVLEETLEGLDNVRVVRGDVLKADLTALLGAGPWQVVANLPYYLTTPAISRLLEQGELFDRITLMVQREVADRLSSPPGSKDYGSLSVYVQSRRRVRTAFPVSRTCFYPPPRVDSAVVVLEPLPAPLVPAGLEQQFSAVVRAAFGQRRKRLDNALAAGLGLSRPQVHQVLQAAGVDSGLRAEQLAVAQFTGIARALAGLPEGGKS